MNKSYSDPIKILPKLVKSVARGSCVLFLGTDVSYNTHDWIGPPTRAELTIALAHKYDWVSSEQKLHFATEEFLSRDPANLHELVTFVREHILTCSRPGPLHRLIVDLGFDAVVTNGYDSLVEMAMQEAGRRMLQVVGDAEIAYAGSKEEVIVIHLAGITDRPESLVLTYEDQIKVENRLSEKLQAVRGWCALRPLLFVGWDPEDDGFRRLYYAATENLGRHRRQNYLVWLNPSRRAGAFCNRYNVEIISAEPLSFLNALDRLVQQAHTLQPGYRPGGIVGKLPYKFLDYYTPKDRDIFCGREVEAPLVYRIALSYPLLTLFGQSGVGKTSLLLAGIVPLLSREGYNYAYIRALGDPLQAIREGVCRALGIEYSVGDTLLDFFRQALGAKGRLVVILDQFEELFIRSSKQTRRQFWRELGTCVGLVSPEVRFILSLREDYLADLDEARHPLDEGESAPIPTILRNSYRLTSLDVDTAYLAIVEPARRARCTVEPQLADVLLGRIEMPDRPATEPRSVWSLVEVDGMVPPPSLQIVMDCLYRQALDIAGHYPPAPGTAGRGWPPPRLTLTLDLYQSLSGARKILADYVSGALDRVPQMTGDRAMAQILLKVMVTSQATKAALNDAEMMAEIGEVDPHFDPKDGQAVDCLRDTRKALVNLRLVRSFKVGGSVLYELAHDHMATEIATWISEGEMQTKLTRELLRREMQSWHSLGKLIELTSFKLIHEEREKLRRLTSSELELLFRSALDAGHEIAYWFKRAYEGGAPADEIAVTGLKDENFRVRAAAVAALEQSENRFFEPIIEMLKDDYPQVRVAAIHALERLQPDGVWRKHLVHECYVPEGSFIMGDDSGNENERPAHELYLQAFYIAKYQVTNAEFKRHADDIGRFFPIPEGKANHPVVNVNWYDAQGYAKWAGMRLLTEAEWEKAASWVEKYVKNGEQRNGVLEERGRKRVYPYGDEFDQSKCSTAESSLHDTTPVGKYSPEGDSSYGCADMAGNVWEWTSSLYKNYPYQKDDGREDPDASGNRMIRGGSSFVNAGSVRSASRSSCAPDYAEYDNGCRFGVGTVSDRPSSPHTE